MPSPIPRLFDGWVVMVVDDEEDSLEVARLMMKLAGAQVFTAVNGRHALETLKTTLPHFILSDLSMPDMDGWELVHLLQQDRRTINIPVIALTAHAMPGDRERAVAAGFYNHISKPLDPMKFVSQVARILMDVPSLALLLNETSQARPGVDPNA